MGRRQQPYFKKKKKRAHKRKNTDTLKTTKVTQDCIQSDDQGWEETQWELDTAEIKQDNEKTVKLKASQKETNNSQNKTGHNKQLTDKVSKRRKCWRDKIRTERNSKSLHSQTVPFSLWTKTNSCSASVIHDATLNAVMQGHIYNRFNNIWILDIWKTKNPSQNRKLQLYMELNKEGFGYKTANKQQLSVKQPAASKPRE